MITHPLRHLLSRTNYWQLYDNLQQSGGLENPKTRIELAYIRAYRDFEFFATYFFAHHCRVGFSGMHLDFCADELEPERRGRREATAAPRGHAKTTFKLLMKTIHAIVYGYESYIVIIGQSVREAKDKVRQVLDELETNDRLIAVYGQLAPSNSRPGPKQLFVSRNGMKVQAISAGQSIRGIKQGANRPTMIILDDVETLEGAMSPTQRQKMRDWFVKDVLKCGQTDGSTNVIFIGTCLHDESLLSEFLEKPGWLGRKYRAIPQFSHREDLWLAWQALYTDLSNPSREQDAQAFYDLHQSELLEGVEVLWPEGDSYLNLMKQKVVEGSASFYSEKQNEPFDPQSQLFKMDQARYFKYLPQEQMIEWELDGRKIPMDQLATIIAFHDPAVGNDTGDSSSAGDYAAIVVVAQDKAGHLYVLDAFIEKVPQSVQIENAFRLHDQWHLQTLYFESNGYQNSLRETYQNCQRLRYKSVILPVKGVNQSDEKIRRISSLEPYIVNGTLLFNRDLPSRLIEQLRLFPTINDDGPDALQGAISQLQQPRFSSTTIQSSGGLTGGGGYRKPSGSRKIPHLGGANRRR